LIVHVVLCIILYVTCYVVYSDHVFDIMYSPISICTIQTNYVLYVQVVLT